MIELPACAALRLKHSGLIVAGHRHHNCISFINYEFGHQGKQKVFEAEHGFMTNKGNFVNRKEAFKLMIKAEIPSACESGYRHKLGELFSEDLY